MSWQGQQSKLFRDKAWHDVGHSLAVAGLQPPLQCSREHTASTDFLCGPERCQDARWQIVIRRFSCDQLSTHPDPHIIVSIGASNAHLVPAILSGACLMNEINLC